jgi:hypothetical protein
VAEVSVASSEFGGEQSIGLCVVGFLPPTGLYNTVLRVRCGAPVYVADILRSGAFSRMRTLLPVRALHSLQGCGQPAAKLEDGETS